MHSSRRFNALIITLCLIVLSFPALAQTKQQLAKTITQYRDQIKTIDFTFEMNSEKMFIEPDPCYRHVSKMVTHITYKGEKQQVEYTAWFNDPKNNDTITSMRTYNGSDSTRAFRNDIMLGNIFPGRDHFVAGYNRIYKAMLFPPYKPIVHDNPSENLDLLNIINAPQTQIRPKHETLFDSECVIIDYTDKDLNVTAWLDIDHNAIPRKIQIASAKDNSLIFLRHIPELTTANNITFPLKTQLDAYLDQSKYDIDKILLDQELNSIKQQQMPAYVAAAKRLNTPLLSGQKNILNMKMTTTVDITKLKINTDIPDTAFDFVYPPGCTVIDLAKNIDYDICKNQNLTPPYPQTAWPTLTDDMIKSLPTPPSPTAAWSESPMFNNYYIYQGQLITHLSKQYPKEEETVTAFSGNYAAVQLNTSFYLKISAAALLLITLIALKLKHNKLKRPDNTTAH